ncbi:MAG TPA: enoyl-ACP reductase [Lentisphaeria bacterium]|nr:MAG: enoyl-ACP reductase [Lentisphaerae bacterium GWF2_50_93]HCE46852.1 enoyl-ACP reductase [Lentisphaeria bacterium]
MSFLGLEGKKILIFGLANRKSVAFHIAEVLKESGAELIFSVLGQEQSTLVNKFFPDSSVHICDVSDERQIQKLATEIGDHGKIYGIVHSIAFASYTDGFKPFHQTRKDDFLKTMDVSCFSFIQIAGLFKPYMDTDGSIVTISISTTRMAAENYGYMAPVKAALDSSICFLAKSLSEDTKIRVNGVGASLLKTSSSAGIPGYVEPYLFAEKATLRKSALKTEEVANVAAFLLSPRSSGINSQTVIVDAGMSVNYFDKAIVKAAVAGK